MIDQTAGWIAPVATMVAAIMTAANLGTRVTGWGFVVFTIGSIAWSIVAISTGQQNLLWANGFLTLVNVVGIWRWLGRQARYDEGGRSAARRSAASPEPSLFPMSGLAGSKLVGADGEVLGTIVDGMLTQPDLGLAYIVVRDGGVGGVGETLYAVTGDELRLGPDGASSNLSPAELRGRPPIPADHWPKAVSPS